jgi:hypothetical protein
MTIWQLMLLYAPDKKVSAMVAFIRDETSRFAEERGLRSAWRNLKKN